MLIARERTIGGGQGTTKVISNTKRCLYIPPLLFSFNLDENLANNNIKYLIIYYCLCVCVCIYVIIYKYNNNNI